jgi:hypothetical protein
VECARARARVCVCVCVCVCARARARVKSIKNQDKKDTGEREKERGNKGRKFDHAIEKSSQDRGRGGEERQDKQSNGLAVVVMA